MRTLITAICLFPFVSLMAIGNNLKVKVNVIGEDNLPIEEASVKVGFFGPSGTGTLETGMTNEEGSVEVAGSSRLQVRVTIDKEGYYTSEKKYDVRKKNDDGKIEVVDQNLIIVLRKKLNPIPLYTKKYTGFLPEKGSDIGFDLQIGDWVNPYGQGEKSDFIFHYTGYVNDFFNYSGELNVSFSNAEDGMLSEPIDERFKSSKLTLDYTAPIDGEYLKERKFIRSRVGKGKDTKKENTIESNTNYFVRLRTELNEDDEIIKANYAKIYNGIVFDPRSDKGVASIHFTYYFNPEVNDTNLEFDPKKNLFTNLKSLEKVYNP